MNTRNFRTVTFVLFLIIGCFSCYQYQKKGALWDIESPDRTLKLILKLSDKGTLTYQISKRDELVVLPSQLGLIRKDQAFDSLLTIHSLSELKSVDYDYKMVSGKKLVNHYAANERSFVFSNPSGGLLEIIFQISNEGVAFRYIFPEEDHKRFTIVEEKTSFAFSKDTKGWLQPYDSATQWTPAYENYYLSEVPYGITSPTNKGWCFPALFKSNNHWVYLTESDLGTEFYGAHIRNNPGKGYQISLPEPEEGLGTGNSYAQSQLPWVTPWRVFIIDDELKTIVESNLVSSLASPPATMDFSWVKPGKASWSWWSDHSSSKDVNKLKSFVDLAHEMGWEYSLIDANWNTIPADDFGSLIDYATSKNVGLWLWYNSGGPHNSVTEMPRDVLYDEDSRKEELRRLRDIGIKGIKIDFFQSDKQSVIGLYLDILRDAAENKIMVNFHGSTIPRGWSRTWPNLLSMESAKGAESYSFSEDFPEKAPMHNVNLAYTRNVTGPMDYTPVTFSDQKYSHITTNAHELALSLIFESGILHLADDVSSFDSLPEVAKRYLRHVPVVWDQTKFLSGYPGKDITLARKSGDKWYVGHINGENHPKNIVVALDFLDSGENYEGYLIKDGENSRSFDIQQFKGEGKLEVPVLANGGFVLYLEKSNN